MENRKLQAEWARFSKEREGHQDYHIVAASGPIEPRLYERLVRRYLPGTPPREANDKSRADALPWVWFGPSGHSQEPDLGAAIMTFGNTRDRAGRRTDPTTYLRIPWEELSHGRPTYATLAETLRGFTVPAGGGGPVPLEVPPFDPESVAETIENAEFERAAATAALLLEKPVVLVNAGALPLKERVAALDAIVSLLPYGFRAHLAVSTWAQTSRSFRLSFATRPGSEQQPVDWRRDGAAPPPPEHPDARAYLTLLKDLQQRPGYQLTALLKYLATKADPCEVDFRVALEHLESFDLPHAAWKAVRDGRGDPETVRELFRSHKEDSLTSSQVSDLVAFLTLHAQMSDFDWISDPSARAPLPYLFTAIVSKLPDPGQRQVVDRLLDLAGNDGDRVLADLVNIKASTPKYLEALTGNADLCARRLLESARSLSRDEASALQRETIALLRHRIDAPDATRDERPLLRTALAEDPGFVYNLVASQVRHGHQHEAGATMRWLFTEPGRLDSTLLLLHLLFQGHPCTARDFQIVEGRLGRSYVRRLVEIGCRLAVIEISELWRWFAATEPPEGAERDAWRNVVQALAQVPGRDPRSQVCLGVLDLLVQDEPSLPVLQGLDAEGADQYVAAFRDAYWGRRLDSRREGLTSQLVAHLSPDWAAQPREIVEQTLQLLHAVGQSPDQRQAAADVVALVEAAVEERPDILAWPVWKRWSETLRDSPKVALATLRHYPSTQPEPGGILASLFATALGIDASGEPRTPVAEVADVLRSRGHLQSLEQIDGFLAELPTALKKRGAPGAPVLDIEHAFIVRIVEGALGDQLAGAYLTDLVERAPAKVRYWAHQLSFMPKNIRWDDRYVRDVLKQLGQVKGKPHTGNPGGTRTSVEWVSGSPQYVQNHPLVQRSLSGLPPPRDQHEQNHPAALPWVWFCPSDKTLGAVITDGQRREHTPWMTYLKLSWDLRMVRPTYTALATALGNLARSLPEEEGSGRDPLEGLDELDPTAIAHTIDDFGFAKVASIAAMLLDTPVSIGNGPESVEGRLDVIDAITALLPYGYRAKLRVSTWAEPVPSSTDGLALSISNRPPHTGAFRRLFPQSAYRSRHTFDWGTDYAVHTGPSDDAGTYRRLLLRHGQAIEVIEAIVAHLAAQTTETESDPFTRANQACNLLERLPRPPTKPPAYNPDQVPEPRTPARAVHPIPDDPQHHGPAIDAFVQALGAPPFKPEVLGRVLDRSVKGQLQTLEDVERFLAAIPARLRQAGFAPNDVDTASHSIMRKLLDRLVGPDLLGPDLATTYHAYLEETAPRELDRWVRRLELVLQKGRLSEADCDPLIHDLTTLTRQQKSQRNWRDHQ